MTRISSDRIASIEARRHELQQAMSRSDLSPDEFVRLSKDYAAIEPVAAAAREVRRLRAELEVLNGMVADPTSEPELKDMAAPAMIRRCRRRRRGSRYSDTGQLHTRATA